MSGGGSTTSSSQTANKDVWEPAKNYITGVLGSASDVYNNAGSAVVPQSNTTLTGQALVENTALNNSGIYNPTFATALGLSSNGTGLTSDYNAPISSLKSAGTQFGDIYSGASQPTAASKYLTGIASSDGSTNPWLQAQLDANASRIGNRVASQMSGSGRYGSFGHADALARTVNETNLPLLSSAYESDQNRKITAANSIDAAARAADTTKLNATAGQASTANNLIDTYNTGQQNQYNWASLLPTLNSLQYDSGNRLMSLGNTKDTYSQSEADSPWTQLSRYSSVLSQLGSLFNNAGTTTATGTSNTEKEYGLLDYLSLFGGGNKSTASGLANAGSSVLSLLSDRTEKTDIKKVGTDEATGLGIFAYRYKGDPKTYPKMVGPMAQEVEEKFPGSTERVGGKLAIKGEALGILSMLKKAA